MSIRSVVILLAAVVWLGCSDSNGTNDGSGGNSSLTGDLTGKVTLTDYRGQPMADKSGVLVQVDGTSYTALTDTNGVWMIHDLPSKTYSLTFSKEGFFTWRDRSFSFLGGGLVRYEYNNFTGKSVYFSMVVPIVGLPQYTITLDALLMPIIVYSDSIHQYINIVGSIYGHSSQNTPPRTSLNTVAISGASANLSIDNPSSYRNIFSMNFYNNSSYNSFSNYPAQQDSSADLTLHYFDPLLNGFSKGDTIYIRVYPSLGESQYYDDIRDIVVPVYSANGSNVLSAIVP
jgi:hypothetical protein